MHFCGSGFVLLCFFCFAFIYSQYDLLWQVRHGQLWVGVCIFSFYFFLFLPMAPGGISFFVYADAMKMKYMLLDIRTQDHGLSLDIPSGTFPPPLPNTSNISQLL